MIPKLPKEFLWTDLDTMDEFFKLDPVNEDFYETFMIMREEPFDVKLDAVKVFNEVYYHATIFTYLRPNRFKMSNYIHDIKANLGWNYSAKLVLSMIYWLIEASPQSYDTFKTYIFKELSECIYWRPREDKDKREPLKAYVVGCLKDAGVISGTYDGIARVMGYDEESYRSFSRNLGRGKNQDYFLWIKAYVEKSRLEQ